MAGASFTRGQRERRVRTHRVVDRLPSLGKARTFVPGERERAGTLVAAVARPNGWPMIQNGSARLVQDHADRTTGRMGCGLEFAPFLDLMATRWYGSRGTSCTGKS